MNKELNKQLMHLQALQKAEPFPSIETRKRCLIALKKGLQNHAYTLAKAINKDFSHRSEEETLFCEIFTTITAINFVLSHLKQWMNKRKRKVSWQFMPAYAYLLPQPLGVVGIMVPWNYPIFLSLVPAIYALAAGNKVMIKMSELSPNLGQALHTLIHSLGLHDEISVINGDVELSKSFASLPFNHLLFTGSTRVGKEVMRAASDNLTPVTLELGGKSPAIVSKTMPKQFLNRLFMGKMFNAGQTCIAPDYLLIPSEWQQTITEALEAFIQKHYPQIMQNKDYSAIISETHKKRLLALVDDARAKGARVHEFGSIQEGNSKLPVYLLFDVSKDMAVMQEEIFGPIIPVLTYTTFDEALSFVNAAPNPLALYYFGEDSQEITQIQQQTLSGALVINESLIHAAVDDLPFGGVGFSGMGRYHGQEGFDTFSQLKPVMVQRRFSSMSMMYPPYGRMMRLFLRWVGGIKPE